MKKIYHNGVYYTPAEMKKIVEAYYFEVANQRFSRFNQIQLLFPPLAEEDCVLDYGCGMGGISKSVVDKYNCQVDAVDISDNELEKARVTYSHIENISFITLEKFCFSEKKYDLVISSQVVEHVHNVGNYLNKINHMLKENGYLLIGLPNIVNFRFMGQLLFFSNSRARKHSKMILEGYNKATHHVNGWDPLHFITMCSSCGFELQEYLSVEGLPLPFYLKKIPLVGKYIPVYLNLNIPLLFRLSYTMLFLFKKVKYVPIEQDA